MCDVSAIGSSDPEIQALRTEVYTVRRHLNSIQYGESGNYVQVEGFVSRPEISKLINYTAPLSKIVANVWVRKWKRSISMNFGCQVVPVEK